MSIENKLQLLQQQKLVLTPELKQAITILQLPLLELENYLEEQLQENPVLELDISEQDSKSLEESQKEQNVEEWLDYFADRSDLGLNRGEEKKDYRFDIPSSSLPELEEILKEQARMIFSGEDKKIAFYIIDNIDNNGYLNLKDDEITTALGITLEKYQDILNKIQQFEPIGVGARNLAECLAIQILHRDYAEEEKEILTDLVQRHLDLVAAGKVAKLSQIYRKSPQEIQKYLDIIKKFNPHPGAPYGGNKTVYIVPDLVVENVSGHFIIIVNDAAVPRITMSETYLALLQGEADEKTKKYIQQKVHAATWLLKSIEQRRLTLYKVANAILETQYDFFEFGKAHLKPMTLKQIATIIKMHESTVSRAIANKYIQTPHGVFPLKFFFTGGLQTASGEDTSVAIIKDEIKKLIKNEDEKAPLSDQRIAEILAVKGINISRRTVAKYREEMHILSSAKRKRY